MTGNDSPALVISARQFDELIVKKGGSSVLNKYDIAAYIWPAYTGDEPRTRIFWPDGIGEWQSIKNAKAKFPGHEWPRKPLMGYVNEANPDVMEMEIELAAKHGVNVFIYDWYWYDRRPFLEQCLNNGYLQAKNNDKVKFYLMWANHDATHLLDKRISDKFCDQVIWNGGIDRPEFERIGKRLIEKYFSHPSYYKIDGKPVFQIYDTVNLVDGLGGMIETKAALDWLDEECKKAGLPGVYLMMTTWNSEYGNMSGTDWNKAKNSSESYINALGYSGMTHYQFAHFAHIERDYLEILKDVKSEWDKMERNYDKTYYPHISVGWDNNPRFNEIRGYGIKNNTPEAIEQGLIMAKDYIDSHPDIAPLITINSWNEWSETSYLLPDDIYGYGYLEAIKKVFMK